MAKQCRSLRRAMKRGHAVNANGTYKSKKENRILHAIWKATLKKQQQIQENNGNTEEQL